MLWATMRRTPAASLAATRLAVPSRRSRALAAASAFSRSVSWWMTASGAATMRASTTASSIIGVDNDRLGPERGEPGCLGRSPRQTCDPVTLCVEEGDDTPPDHAGRAGHDHVQRAAHGRLPDPGGRGARRSLRAAKSSSSTRVSIGSPGTPSMTTTNRVHASLRWFAAW